MPNFVKMTNRRKADLLPDERVLTACPFASPKAVIRWLIGTSGPDSGANVGAAAGPAGGIIGGLATAGLAAIGLKRFLEISDDDGLSTGQLALPHFIMFGVTDSALLIWRYEPGKMGSDLLQELLYRIPRTAVRTASTRREGFGVYACVEFVDGATFVAEIPPAYPRRGRRVMTELARTASSTPTTTTPIDWLRLRAAPPEPKPPPSALSRAAGIAVIATVVALLAISLVQALRPQVDAPSYTEHSLAGTVTVEQFTVLSSPDDAGACVGAGVSADIAEGQLVKVSAVAGTPLASVMLHAGVPQRPGGPDAPPTSTTTPSQPPVAPPEYVTCQFVFFVIALRGAPSYRVTVGTMAPRDFTYDELERKDWHISL